MLIDDYGDSCLETRVLPLNGDSNIICGIRGYHREMEHRKYMNKKLSKEAKWDLPKWEDLEVYQTLKEETHENQSHNK